MRTISRKLVRYGAWIFAFLFLANTGWAQSLAESWLFGDTTGRALADSDVAVPPYPKKDALIPFTGITAPNRSYFIDANSISITPEGIMRYTVVIKTAGGGENVMYEGLHCQSARYRPYAFGRAGGTWSSAKSSEWKRIEVQDKSRHYGVLFSDYFCSGRTVPIASVEMALERLRSGGIPLRKAE